MAEDHPAADLPGDVVLGWAEEEGRAGGEPGQAVVERLDQRTINLREEYYYYVKHVLQ